ncbi:MAG: hypothetical protein WAU75_01100 [Solirubrobacteraceae bacterium]
MATLAMCAGVAAIAPAASAAPISKATRFQALGIKVSCGIEIHSPSTPPREVLCAARGIPAPKGPGAGDPGFVQLAVIGAPRLLRLSQDSFVAGATTHLARGRLWNQLGVTCHVAEATVMCFNGNNHGFVIGNGHYRSF